VVGFCRTVNREAFINGIFTAPNNSKMETVLVQINNNKAYRLLENLEDLHIIKVLKKCHD
jgi:hypothetical protein